MFIPEVNSKEKLNFTHQSYNNLLFVGGLKICFLKIWDPTFKIKLLYMDQKCKGKFIRSDNNVTTCKAVKAETLYTPKERKVLKSSSVEMYLPSQETEKFVDNHLGKLKQELIQMQLDGNCLYSKVLKQISHLDCYTASDCQQQVAYHAAANFNVFLEDLEPFTESCYENYLQNIYYNNVCGDLGVLAIIAHMWNVAIDVVSPIHSSVIHIFHDCKVPDIVLVHNGHQGQDGHFSATKKLKN